MRRVMTVQPPKTGAVLRWGRDEPGADPDVVGAWAPGSKAAAHALMAMVHSHRQQLEEAGIDITSIRISCETEPVR